MFSKTKESTEIKVTTSNKTRRMVIRTAYELIRFKNKIDKKTHLSLDPSWRSDQVGEATVWNLVNSKYKNKQVPYDITGKTLKLVDGNYGPELHEITTNRTDSFFLPEYKELNDYISSFANSKDFYSKENLIYKSGIILYGHPGNGKSSWIRYVMNNSVLPKDTIFIWCDRIPPTKFVDAFREVNCLKVFIFEEVTSNLSHSEEVKEFLTFMDGEQSLDNAIYIATTNHPEQLPQNVVERPGRFDLIVEIDNPKEESREVILKHYFKADYQEEMVRMSKGLSHAEIMYTFILAKKHQVTFEKAVKKLKDHKEFVKNGFEKYRKIGFEE